jgi:DNA transformation protein and related proteins
MISGRAPEATQSIAHILDLLQPWAAVAPRRMFSGIGLFRAGVMFGLVIRDTLHFKTDDINRGDYEAAGMVPFSYERAGRGVVATSYHAVPLDLLADGDDLWVWPHRAGVFPLPRRKPDPRRKSATPPRERNLRPAARRVTDG